MAATLGSLAFAKPTIKSFKSFPLITTQTQRMREKKQIKRERESEKEKQREKKLARRR